LTEGMAANFAMDFAKSNASAQFANAPGTGSSSPEIAATISRLPQVEANSSVYAAPYAAQPATAVETTPSFIR
jgi:hypothetical protein